MQLPRLVRGNGTRDYPPNNAVQVAGLDRVCFGQDLGRQVSGLGPQLPTFSLPLQVAVRKTSLEPAVHPLPGCGTFL
jgi:hypothetical protein